MKEEILDKLKENSGQFISGETLSDTLGVSRTAIWKHMKELKEEGYIIESVSKKGYRLLFVPDILNEHEIKQGLETELIGQRIDYIKTIDSTNKYAKEIAAQGCVDGTVVVADSQTAGRGRLGRDWNSADRKGIWMSVVLRPSIPPEEVQLITLAASVAVSSAIYNITGLRAGIKWPNDILLDGKKVCGILTEMSCEMEQVNFLVVGLGINVSHEPEDFPEDLRQKATSIKQGIEESNYSVQIELGKCLNRSRLIKEILLQLEKIYNKLKIGLTKEIIEQWKINSVTLGRQVKIMAKGSEYIGTAIDITDDGKLVLSLPDGTRHEVVSGEVSVRGLLGYS
ncbi:MAG: biotin--[acetyl-CoA-carboxylase] ligase [Clostridiales bacterium]|jgi:BirA family biotin operon repressor/biotin-[acetyl-CoA-carboxylase] ligase|nr:biotin--[acetyl-CoA-carboxylase] ligase [Clostridiales bacterium]